MTKRSFLSRLFTSAAATAAVPSFCETQTESQISTSGLPTVKPKRHFDTLLVVESARGGAMKKIKDGYFETEPFILCKMADGELKPFWCEFRSGLPSEIDVSWQPEISPFQTLNDYRNLPKTEREWKHGIDVRWNATVERIPDGILWYYQLDDFGCDIMWTMLPRNIIGRI